MTSHIGFNSASILEDHIIQRAWKCSMRCCYSKAEDNITYSLTLKIQDLERDYRIINK